MQVTLPIVIEWFVISDKTSAKYNFFITFYPRSSSHIIFHTKLYINCRKVLPYVIEFRLVFLLFFKSLYAESSAFCDWVVCD